MIQNTNKKSTSTTEQGRNYDREIQRLAALGLSQGAICAALGISIAQIKRKPALRKAYYLGRAEPQTRAGVLLLAVISALERRINTAQERAGDINTLIEIVKLLDRREAAKETLREKARYNRARLAQQSRQGQEAQGFIATCEPMTEAEAEQYGLDRFAGIYQEQGQEQGGQENG